MLRCARNDAEMEPHAPLSSPRRRGSSTLRLLGSITDVSGILGHPPARVTTVSMRRRSRDMNCPRFASSVALIKIRGRREDRVRAAPAVSCAACAWKENAHEHTGSAEASRPSLRNGFTAYFVLFPENGSFASVARKTLSHLVDLAPAPRRRNHTTSPYASATLVCHGIRVHRISPRVSDDGQRPSSRRETSGVMPLIWGKTEATYF